MTMYQIKPIRHPDRIRSYLFQNKWTALAIVVFGIAFNGAMVLSPIYQGKLIDAIVDETTLANVLRIVITFVSLVLAIQTARFFKRFYVRKFANVATGTMRKMIYHTILSHSLTQLETENVGNLMTRVVSDVDLCVEGLRKLLTEIFDTGVLMLAYAIAMFAYDVKISLLSMLFIPVAMILAESLKGFVVNQVSQYRKKSGEIADLTYDLMENSMLYRVSGMETTNRKRYETELMHLETLAVKANILENSMQPIYNVIATFGIILVIYFGATKVIDGDWSIGVFSTYLTMFFALAVKASKASKLFNSVQKSQVSWQRIRPYMHEYGEKEESKTIPDEPTTLVVSGLGLRYQSTQSSTIEGISFRAKQGEIIGITGPIASGKSTLGLALSGLYAYEGSILINGKELRDYSPIERSSLIAYHGHRPQLFSASIAENIAMGDDGSIDQALHAVAFDSDMATMPKGLNTLVGNQGIRLSGGQQARIALARTLARNAKILLLDDPFASVDMATEEMILRQLREKYRNTLILLISHRLAVFPELDHILLMQNGQVILSGNHTELMQSSSLYSSIYRLQSSEGGERHEA